MALNGESDRNSEYMAVKESPFASSVNSNVLALRKTNPADNNTPVPFGYKKPKGSPFG